MKLIEGCCVTEEAIRGGAAMLISVREVYKYAREHIEGDRLALFSPFGVKDFGEHRKKMRVFYCRSARTSFNTSLLRSKGFRDAYGLSGGLIGWKAAELATRSKRDVSGEGGGNPVGWL